MELASGWTGRALGHGYGHGCRDWRRHGFCRCRARRDRLRARARHDTGGFRRSGLRQYHWGQGDVGFILPAGVLADSCSRNHRRTFGCEQQGRTGLVRLCLGSGGVEGECSRHRQGFQRLGCRKGKCGDLDPKVGSLGRQGQIGGQIGGHIGGRFGTCVRQRQRVRWCSCRCRGDGLDRRCRHHDGRRHGPGHRDLLRRNLLHGCLPVSGPLRAGLRRGGGMCGGGLCGGGL